MNLREVSVEGHRSIKSELRLVLTDRTTILLGANDHGKTNVLDALRHLNGDEPFRDGDLNWDCEKAGEASPRRMDT